MFPGRTKRQKEQQRNEHKKEKEARKEERKKEKEALGPRTDGADPDIAHIIPGPQPKLEE
jgi:hypothetical protein